MPKTKTKKARDAAKREPTREEKQGNTLALLNALHDAGFSSLTITSSEVGRGYTAADRRVDYMAHVSIERESMSTDELAELIELCALLGARLYLASDHVDGRRTTRLAVAAGHEG